MTEENIVVPGLTRQEFNRLMDAKLSVADRMTVWQPKILGVQARKVQNHWKAAIKGPLILGLVSCPIALGGLTMAIFGDSWRLSGITVVCFWYLLLAYVVLEYHRLDRLHVIEI